MLLVYQRVSHEKCASICFLGISLSMLDGRVQVPASLMVLGMKRSTSTRPAVNVNGKIHYFDWAIFHFANCQKLPEATHPLEVQL